MLTWNGCMLAVWTVAQVLPAQGATPADLVRRLGSNNFAEREDATRGLERLGEAALPQLDVATRQGELETRRRAALVLGKIQDRLIAKQLLPARTIQLHWQDASLSRVFLDLQAQTKLQMKLLDGVGDLGAKRVTLHADNVPIWDALAKFEKATGLTETFAVPAWAKERAAKHPWQAALTHLAVPQAVGLRNLVYGIGPAPFPVDARTSVRFRLLPYAVGQGDQDLYFLEVRPDPELLWYRLDSVRVTHAGAPLAKPIVVSLHEAPPNERPRELPERDGEPTNPWHSIPIAVPRRPNGEPVRTFEGAIEARVYGNYAVVAVDDLRGAVGSTRTGLHGVTLKIEAVQPGEGELTVQVRLENLEGLAEVSPLPRVVRLRAGLVAMRGPSDLALESLEVRDVKNRVLKRVELHRDRDNNPSAARGQFTFERRPGDNGLWRLVIPGQRLVNLEVPFAFGEVRLP